ncbi:antitoxin HicB [uncultured archaeon]|nr:antitoxin HicB [uncultured archaeon]
MNNSNPILIKFTVILEPQEEGGFTVTVPALPGCISEGETIEEALNNIKEAIELYIKVLKEDEKPIPQDVGEEVLLDA